MLQPRQSSWESTSWACFPGAEPPQIPIDSNGNLTQKTEGADVWGYEWNAESQLTRVTKNALEQARFIYDALGRRVEKVAGGVTTSYTYDGANILREIRGSATLKYVQGLGVDAPLAVDDGTALSYFHADALGSIVKMTNGAGVVTLARQYDAWGNLEVGASEPGYAFTGREWDPETGLYYYRARSYDPKAGRFILEDPMRFVAGGNFYAYVENSPTNRKDPSGLVSAGGDGCCKQDWLTCMGNCLAQYDPLGPAGDTLLTVAGGTFPKVLIGARPVLGASRMTTTMSAAAHVTRRAGLRPVGRFFSPIWVTYGNYLFFVEVHCAAACAGWACAY